MRARYAVLAVALAVMASACGSGATPAPTGPTQFKAVLAGAGKPVTLTVTDHSGLVTGVVGVDGGVPLNPQESAELDRSGSIVRAGPDASSVIVVWGSGTCTPSQSMAIAPKGDGWEVQIDLGQPVGDVCDMMLISLAAKISASAPLDSTRIHASVAQGTP